MCLFRSQPAALGLMGCFRGDFPHQNSLAVVTSWSGHERSSMAATTRVPGRSSCSSQLKKCLCRSRFLGFWKILLSHADGEKTKKTRTEGPPHRLVGDVWGDIEIFIATFGPLLCP